MLEVKKLNKTYKLKNGHCLRAVTDVSFQIEKGKVLGLLGNNGAGKTTIIKIICNIVSQDSGSVLIDGFASGDRNHYMPLLSAVLEGTRNTFWNMTVLDNIKVFAAMRGISYGNIRDETNHYIKLLELAGKENEIVGRLSNGMKQKVSILVALITNPAVLCMDDPTLGLDVQSISKIKEITKQLAMENGKAVLITTHDMNFVDDVCDDIVIINRGVELYNGSMEYFKDHLRPSFKYRLSLCSSEPIQNSMLKDYQQDSFLYFSPAELYKVLSILNAGNIAYTRVDLIEPRFEDLYCQFTSSGGARAT